MASTISRTPWPIRIAAADPAKSRYGFAEESHSTAPSPRTAAGKVLLKERRNTEERGWDGAGSDTLKLSGGRYEQVKDLAADARWSRLMLRRVNCAPSSNDKLLPAPNWRHILPTALLRDWLVYSSTCAPNPHPSGLIC